MINARNVTYKPVAVLEDGTQLDLSRAVEELGWEEGENELAMRISFSVQDAKFQEQRLSALLKPGVQIIILSDWGSGHEEVARGSITDWEPVRRSAEDTLGITAYDELLFFEKSQDVRCLNAGASTKAALAVLFAEWGIPEGTYLGPDIAHERTVYKNKTLAYIVKDLLDTARKQGGPRCFARCAKGKVDILPYGNNAAVYHFDEDTSLTVVKPANKKSSPKFVF